MVRRASHALARGALELIETAVHYVEDGGIRFLVRKLCGPTRKPQASADAPATERNPFLPYDEDLFVTELTDTHVCLLNKFSVIEHHVLIATRAFVPQRSLLTARDFQALWLLLADVDGLGFYNAGGAAGASQPHKHLQLVPLPLVPGGPPVPIEPLLRDSSLGTAVTRIEALPFPHAVAALERGRVGDPLLAARASYRRYLALLAAAGLPCLPEAVPLAETPPYNLLLTRRWMLLVPRSRERYRSISVNALGFAGSLLVGDSRQLRLVETVGPLAVLRGVTPSG